jgi:polysaccharide pyruvyl transferase WcaK-like protein
VAINVASDMPGVRFSGFKCGNPQAAFACEFARAIEAVADVMPETDFVMMPHIFRDLDVQYQIIANLPDRLRRTRLIVAPFGSGNRAARHVFGLYAMTDMTLGMRFHANVCSIGMQKQTLGLACYPQISALYEELGQSDRILDVSKPGFVWPLVEAVRQALYAPDAFSGSPGEALVSAQALRDDVEPEVQGWLTLHYGA